MSFIRHNCGIVVGHDLSGSHEMLGFLGHRGREASGTAFIGDGRIDVVKYLGPSSAFDVEDLIRIFPGHIYHTYLEHCRYATQGQKRPEDILRDAHPHVIGGTRIDKGDHILYLDCEAVIVHNGELPDQFLDGFARDCLKSQCDSEAGLHYYMAHKESTFMRNIPGAYTLAIATRHSNEVIVMRDRLGMHPGVLGKLDGKYVVASEDIAIRKAGGKIKETLTPGAVYYLGHDGDFRKDVIVEPNRAHCMFEWNYISDFESCLDGVLVRNIREGLGRKLAQELPLNDYDFVTYAPRCPEIAAWAYADELRLHFLEDVFYKMKSERSFMGPDMDERWKSIKRNLHLNPLVKEKLRGKRVIIIDDSTIRSNTSRRVKMLMDEAQVAEATLINYTPPIGIIGDDGINRGCMFGVDIHPEEPNFIARGRSLEEITEKVGMKIRYLSVEGMLETFEEMGLKRDVLCYFCIGGPHPFDRLK